MKLSRMMRFMTLAATGAMIFQTATCTFLDFLQTVLLGITAGGAWAIIQNI
ncbi:MAG: hypothetical protein ACYTHJ_18535 [Planctomycetota bacterium]|jgi:hypothetical protein